jgi:hypothetical protein
MISDPASFLRSRSERHVKKRPPKLWRTSRPTPHRFYRAVGFNAWTFNSPFPSFNLQLSLVTVDASPVMSNNCVDA